MSCIERCPHFRGKFLFRKHIWNIAECPEYRGVLISGVSFKRGSTVVIRVLNRFSSVRTRLEITMQK